MTRKHFNALAETLRDCKPSKNGDSFEERLSQWEQMVRRLSSTCRQLNPNFNESRFLSACNVD
jgi:hypothetical protein